MNVLELPGQLRWQLFDAFQLEIRYDRYDQQITIKVATPAAAYRPRKRDSGGRISARPISCFHV